MPTVLGGEKNGYVFMTYASLKNRFTLAHELGHLVGLPFQDDPCTTGEQHLMCSKEGSASTGTIKACGTANQNAFFQQGKLW